MKKHIKVRRLIGKRSYNTTELAEVLGVHPQTVRTWRADGLKPIYEQAHHSLYLGQAVREYYYAREKVRKVTLRPGEGYCFRCKAGRRMVDEALVDTGRKMGKEKKSMQWVGECVECGGKMRKFACKPTKVSADGEGINIDGSPPLYHSLTGGKD